jgi:hypothetical protein
MMCSRNSSHTRSRTAASGCGTRLVSTLMCPCSVQRVYLRHELGLSADPCVPAVQRRARLAHIAHSNVRSRAVRHQRSADVTSS